MVMAAGGKGGAERSAPPEAFPHCFCAAPLAVPAPPALCGRHHHHHCQHRDRDHFNRLHNLPFVQALTFLSSVAL